MNQGQANARQLPAEDINAVIEANNSEEIYNTAIKYLGTPYCRGGESSRCFDCSGFTQFVYGKKNIDIARTTYGQRDQAREVTREEAVKGDLVFFISNSGYVYHVGIYAGDGIILHSPKPGRSVKFETIWSSNVSYGRM